MAARTKHILIGFFTIQEGVDGADFGLVIFVRFYRVVAVETFYICNGIVQFHIAAKVSWNRFKLIIRIGRVNIE